MADLAKMNPNLHLHYAYSKPRPKDQGNFHSTGYVDMTLIQSLVKAEAEYFLCGSPAFMDSLRSGLMSANVPNDRIFFESFTKEKKASTKMETQTETIPEGIQVSFQRSHKAVAWKDDGVSLLELAENAGLSPDYSCRQGICGTCECRVIEGEVEYLQSPSATISQGSALICISKPKSSKLILDL
jgi:ferredoxin